jgi:hypothetical protein
MLLLAILIFYLCNYQIEAVDCGTARDNLIIPSDGIPNNTILIQSHFAAFAWNGGNSSIYPYTISPSVWVVWRPRLNPNYTSIIGSTRTTAQKHQEIYYVAKQFMDQYLGVNKSFFLCIPLCNWGYWGDYLKCRY